MMTNFLLIYESAFAMRHIPIRIFVLIRNYYYTFGLPSLYLLGHFIKISLA